VGGTTFNGRTVLLHLSAVLVLAACAVFAAWAPGAAAKTIKPNRLGDHAPNGCTKHDCTLREAVIKANDTAARDKIVLRSHKTYKLKTAGPDEDAAATGDLDLANPVTVKTKGKRATVNAKGIDRVFHVPVPGANVTLANLTIRGGLVSTDSGTIAQSGGGLQIDAGDVKIVKDVFTHNEAQITGGGLDDISTGQLKVSKTTFAGNIADDRGGGLHTTGPTKVTASTFSGNKSANTGGGMKSSSPDLRLRNDTFSRNKAQTDDGGGLSLVGTSSTLNNVTIVRNRAASVGGGFAGTGSITFSNSLIALNHAGTMGADGNCSATVTSAGHNLRGTNGMECIGFTGTGDIVRANPKVAKLAANGGPTKTVALKRGSPAIGKGGNDSEKRDPRGVKRDAHPDIGAFELR
jgi:hypothetical protein